MPANPEGIRRALEPQPMPQLPLFSEQHKKRVGMARAANNNQAMLMQFRHIAQVLAYKNPLSAITIDDLRSYADDIGLYYTSGGWCGSVFKGDEWECVGFKAATHEGSHGRVVRTWRRK